jgi:hypothetical protein
MFWKWAELHPTEDGAEISLHSVLAKYGKAFFLILIFIFIFFSYNVGKLDMESNISV